MGNSSMMNQAVSAEDGTCRCSELPSGNAALPAASVPSLGKSACWSRAQGRQGNRLHAAFPCYRFMPWWGWDPQGTKSCLQQGKYINAFLRHI